MRNNNPLQYYRVYKNDTAVSEVSANDFKPLKLKGFKNGFLIGLPIDEFCSVPSHFYSFPPDGIMYYDYKDKILAMEQAKAGALTYINFLIKDVERGLRKLKQYRMEHHDDLNNTLLDSNIRRLERELLNK